MSGSGTTGERGAELVNAAAVVTMDLVRVRELSAAHAELAALAREEASVFWAKRASAIWHLYHDHELTAEQIADMLATALITFGFEAVDGLGVSHDAVRRICGTRANPTPEPVI